MKKQYKEKMQEVQDEIQKVIVWQDMLVRDMLIGLFWKGHILLEWVPGLWKTLAVSTLAHIVDVDFQRIQFTPDLLPSDLIWARVYNQNTWDFSIKKGPIFSNFILADEINRAPSKVQSALLEAMSEKQVTISDKTFQLEKPFMVLATQNPIEQDGTYNLPEAQLDRFLLKTIVNYPTEDEEIAIMKRNLEPLQTLKKILGKKEILEIQTFIEEEIFVDDKIFQYVKDLVFYTRNPHSSIHKYLQFGASPRASIALIRCAKVLAFIQWRDFVMPEDIQEMMYPVLRHRLIVNYEAIAENVSKEQIITKIIQAVKVS